MFGRLLPLLFFTALLRLAHGRWVCGHPYSRGGTDRRLDIIALSLSLIAVDKIFELLLRNEVPVTNHYDESLYYRMTAYRKRHSCETTLLTLIED